MKVLEVLSLWFLGIIFLFHSGLSFTFSLTEEEVKVLELKIANFTSTHLKSELEYDHPSSGRKKNDILPDPKKVFAVLVAGSNGYFNYRHQADVCHAYQILHKNGIPDENIVVMMYDDIANDSSNPTPGVILNRPNGSNVYHGIVKDYTGKDVNPDTFFKVLLGDEKGIAGIGSGKVLKSGPEDHVFINFVDHGAPGLIAFPEEELHASQLKKLLEKMHQNGKFKKLVFYLEACESGSMFDGLLSPHLNIFATTAANSTESSWACYFDEERQTYLGDVYSVMWMENADQVDLEIETLEDQFLLVKNETNTSHVMQFGDRTLRNLPVGDFIGYNPESEKISYDPIEMNPVKSEDVVRIILEKRILGLPKGKSRKKAELELSRLHKMRTLVRTQMKKIVEEVTMGDINERTLIYTSRMKLRNFNCYEKVVKYYSANCFSIAKNPYVTRKLYMFVNMCERGWTDDVMIEVMSTLCHPVGDKDSHLSGIY